jgi:hypothetical protein
MYVPIAIFVSEWKWKCQLESDKEIYFGNVCNTRYSQYINIETGVTRSNIFARHKFGTGNGLRDTGNGFRIQHRDRRNFVTNHIQSELIFLKITIGIWYYSCFTKCEDEEFRLYKSWCWKWGVSTTWYKNEEVQKVSFSQTQPRKTWRVR